MYIINLFGGPSSGKSTLATRLFSELKSKYDIKVEYVHEYAKDLVYEKRFNILSNDQLYIFAKQNHKLKMIEIGGEIDLIINDSPILLSSIFGNLYKSITKKFDDFIIETFNSYNNFNIYINRNDEFFQEYGRVEKKLDEVKLVDDLILNFLNKNNINFIGINNDKNLDKTIETLFENNEFKKIIKAY